MGVPGENAELEHPAEIFGELELLEMLDKFFHLAIYYATLGHERATAGLSSENANRICLKGHTLCRGSTNTAASWLHASEAVSFVESGMRVYIHPGCAEPEALVEALMGRAPHVKGRGSCSPADHGNLSLLRS